MRQYLLGGAPSTMLHDTVPVARMSKEDSAVEEALVQSAAPDAAGHEATRALFERVEALRRAVEQWRFGGGRPAIAVDAALPLNELLARVLAAERANTDLVVAGVPVNPLEDTAEELGRRALVSLSFGNFGAAQALLEEAAGRTRLPELQQRLTLWRALVDFQRRVVMTEITSPVRGAPAQRVLEILDRLDHLPPPEREHYRAEVLRLAELRARAGKDDYLQTVWCLVRARRAMAEQEDVLAMAWLYRAYRLNADQLEAAAQVNEYLVKLLEQARREILRAAGEAMEGAAHIAPEPGDDTPPRAAELYAALAAALTPALGRDVRRDAALFAIAEYQEAPDNREPDQGTHEEGTP
jgi:hypothetical protein